MKIELAIKFGSNEIIVYRKGFGIVTRQSSYVATTKSKSNGKIYAYGDDAKRLCTSKPTQYQLNQPIQGIDIVNSQLAQQLIDYIIKQSVIEVGFISAVVAVPCALTEKKLLELKVLLQNAGVNKTRFVQNAVCVRTNLPQIADDAEVMIIDIGKYLMDISVLTKNSFIAGRNYLIGGTDMDKALKTYIEDNYNVSITEEQAETVKDEIASLYDNDMYTVDFKGITEQNGYKVVTMRANEARVAIVGVYDKMFDLIEETLEILSSQTLAEVKNNGIIFTGGVSAVQGFVEYASKRFDMPIKVIENPRDAVILGAGSLLALNKGDYPYIKL